MLETRSASWWKRFRWMQTSRAEGLVAEAHLLSTMVKAPLSQHDVRVGSHNEDIIHHIECGKSNGSIPLVTIPGYSSGSGFWFRVLGGLAAAFNVYAVDLLGTGMSGRPPFNAKTTEQTEAFFIDSLESWRQKNSIDKMILVGHSLGGYLSCIYAEKYPERVAHLVLVSPAGVMPKPIDWKPPASLQNVYSLRGLLFHFSVKLWDWGLTPGMIVRGTGPLGKRMVEGYCRNRFKQGHHLSEQEITAFEKYAYHVIAQKGSGEHALRRLLAPFAWPRKPLDDRIACLEVPVSFIYGEQDWMRSEGAYKAIEKLEKKRKKLASSDMEVLTTPNAGHWLFMDQPSIFLKQIGKVCLPYMTEEALHALRSAAEALPFYSEPPGDTQAELEEEMEKNPSLAEAHIAADM